MSRNRRQIGRITKLEAEVEALRSVVRVACADRWMDAGHIIVMPPRDSAIRFEEGDPKAEAARRALEGDDR